MAYPAKAIREAIANVLEGSIGTTRTVEEGQLARGVFDGQSGIAQKARSMQKSEAHHRFDVAIGPLRPHPSSAVSATSSRRIDTLGVTITVTTALPSRIQEADRDDVLADIASDADDAIQALTRPGNLDATLDAVSTNIVGGLMLGEGASGHPSWQMISADWTKNIARSQIVGSVIVKVDQ